jgi:hypothetical protein
MDHSLIQRDEIYKEILLGILEIWFGIETNETGSRRANDMLQRWWLDYEKLIDAPVPSHFEIKPPYV